MNIVIDKLKLTDDTLAVLQLIKDTDRYIYNVLMPCIEDCKYLLAEDNIYNHSNILVAKDGDNVAGILVSIDNKAIIPRMDSKPLRKYYDGLMVSFDDNSRYICNVSVDSRYRGMGIATNLIKNCIASSNLPYVELDCLDDNHNAFSLYNHLGFVEVGRAKAFTYGEPSELMDIRMRYTL